MLNTPIILTLTALIFLAPIFHTEGRQPNETPPPAHELSIGRDNQSVVIAYKYGFTDTWHLRSGFFTNLEPDFFTYHFNLGAEARFEFGEGGPQFLAGVEAVSLNYDMTERHLLGGGPVTGVRYDVTERFNVSTELAATIYENEQDEIRWTWHRKVALFLGWRF